MSTQQKTFTPAIGQAGPNMGKIHSDILTAETAILGSSDFSNGHISFENENSNQTRPS